MARFGTVRHMLQFVSYPKSGRSWLRYALTTIDMADGIRFHHDGFEFNNPVRPAHDFSIKARRTRYGDGPPVIYLARDPRDIMVSLYHQITGRYGPVFKYEGDLSAFIRDDYFGAENLQGFRRIWETLCAEGAAMKITYAQCHLDFTGTLSQISHHFDLSLTPEQLVQGQQAAAFDNMKRVEQSRTFPKNWLKPKNGSPKVRRGRVGGYREDLCEADIAYLDAVFEL